MTETVWIHCARPRPHWYEKSEDERTRLRRRWGDIGVESERDGARSLGPYHVRGQHDFETVEIWVFASAQRRCACGGRLQLECHPFRATTRQSPRSGHAFQVDGEGAVFRSQYRASRSAGG